MFDSIFADGSLRDYIDSNLQDPWKGTNFEGYVYLSPKQKGELGERFVSNLMNNLGHKVERAAIEGGCRGHAGGGQGTAGAGGLIAR